MANNSRSGAGEALGLIETKGLIATIAATDAMCKAANVTLAGQIQIGNAFVTTFVRDPTNRELGFARSDKLELGFEVDLGRAGATLAATAFDDRPHEVG